MMQMQAGLFPIYTISFRRLSVKGFSEIDEDVVKICFVSNVFLGTNLIGVYVGVSELNATMKSGKQLHGLALKYELETDVVACSLMVNMYTKCGQMEDSIEGTN
ncbi:hypothetical protein FNV43_RR24567 [Rhamnella rubrinervis]|uniref:Uncharacterized protein n=1 Tax=Rhamnella rubrinervis TaxID=2594499 RepID=A0A8K0GTA7_9ROSA|nr:hypothetical protein FNV43_RR24567 [Rhamnella rubrinervis]